MDLHGFNIAVDINEDTTLEITTDKKNGTVLCVYVFCEGTTYLSDSRNVTIDSKGKLTLE